MGLFICYEWRGGEEKGSRRRVLCLAIHGFDPVSESSKALLFFFGERVFSTYPSALNLA